MLLNNIILLLNLKKIKEYEQILKEINVIQNNFNIVQSKDVKIGDFFTIQKGLSKYTKSYGQLYKGEYPVYSASNLAPLTYINNYDYNGKYLTWTTTGFAGYIKIIEGKFSINGNRGVLISKNNKIDIDFVKYSLEPILRDLAKGRKGEREEDEFTEVSTSIVENAIISIPITSTGEFDIEKQQEIATTYRKVEDTKKLIQQELKKIQEYSLII